MSAAEQVRGSSTGEGLVDAALAEIGQQARAEGACSICHATVSADRRDRHLNWHASLLSHIKQDRLPEVYG